MYRWLFGLSAVFCALMMAVALFFEHVMGMEPCPLCVLQRVVVIVFGGIALLAAIHNPPKWGRHVYAGILFLVSLAGTLLAWRHVWLQSLPKDQVPDCGPGLDYVMEVFSLFEALQFVLKGSGECAEVLWRFLGLTIPGWILVAFIGLMLMSLFVLFYKRKS